MTRDERQELSRIRWIKNKCRGTVVAGTGFGKTRVAINCINTILSKYPTKKIIIVVPSIGLCEQWNSILASYNILNNCQVLVINTAIKNRYKCDVLIIDECHRALAEQLIQVFEVVEYKYILCLTATLERLDGRHELLTKICPIIDVVSLEEAKLNGWVSPYKEYQVIVDVDDIGYYKELNKKFVEYFEFFSFDWNKVTSLLGKDGYKKRLKLRDEMCHNGTEEQRKKVLQQITVYSQQFMRIVQQRKAFINNHPKKLELARLIIQNRPNSKIITFSNNVKMAESIGIGYVYSGKDSKKKGRMTIEEFSSVSSGVLNAIKRADEGLDIPGLSVAIIIGTDSSKIRKTQRIGRCVRAEEGKQAEIFNIIINDTVELEWFRKSNTSNSIITIDEEGLNDVLNGKEPKPYTKKIKDFQFRY